MHPWGAPPLVTTPPAVSVVSPENKTYLVNNISLNFTVSKPAAWMGYSLDGQANMTITGNATLNGLPEGLHNLTVYAANRYGNIGASKTIYFTIEIPLPERTFPPDPMGIPLAIAVIQQA